MTEGSLASYSSGGASTGHRYTDQLIGALTLRLHPNKLSLWVQRLLIYFGQLIRADCTKMRP